MGYSRNFLLVNWDYAVAALRLMEESTHGSENWHRGANEYRRVIGFLRRHGLRQPRDTGYGGSL